MASKIVLLADPAHKDRLLREGGDVARILDSRDLLEHWDPAQVIKYQGQPLTTVLVTLLNRILCHLAVLDSAASVAELRRWYAQFADKAKILYENRRACVHILIVVLTEDLPRSAFDDIRSLLDMRWSEDKGQDESGRVLHRLYVLMPTQNYGQNIAVYSKDDWPVYVAPLLARLDAEPNRQALRSAKAFAWQTCELGFALDRPADAASAFGTLAAELRKKPGRELDGRFHPAVRSLKEHKFGTVVAANASPPWYAYAARADFEEAAKPEKWDQELQKVATEFMKDLTARSVGAAGGADAASPLVLSDPAYWKAVERVWHDVHNEPVFLRVYEDLLAQEPKDAAQKLQAAGVGLEKVFDAWTNRQTNIQRGKECAEELEKAQQAFVFAGMRCVVAGATLCTVAFLAVAMFGLGFGLAVAGACAAGAALSFLPYWLEKRQGAKAKAACVEMVNGINGLTQTYNAACQDCLRNGFILWQEIRARYAGQRLRLLLRRAGGLYDRGMLATTAAAPAAAAPQRPWQSFEGPDQRTKMLRQQHFEQFISEVRRRYQGLAPTGNALDTLLEAELGRFRKEWRNFTSEQDRHNTGCLPAADIIQFLRGFWFSFLIEFGMAGNSQNPPAHWVADQVKAKTGTYNLFSTPIPAIFDPRHRSQFVFVRDKFKAAAQARLKDAAGVTVLTWDGLRESGLCGVYVSEAAVDLK